MADAILKSCSKCGLAKDRSAFNKHSGSKDGLRGYCKSCHTAYSTKWIADNREHYNARIRADRACNPTKYHEWSRAYSQSAGYAEMKRDWVRRNQERRKAIMARYAKKHAVKLHAKVRARQALKLMALPQWADRGAMVHFYREAKRLSRQTGLKHEVDHMVPLQGVTVCGLHCEANLQILSKEENVRKLNRHWPDMW